MMSIMKIFVLWVVYGCNGVVGSIWYDEDGYIVMMVGLDVMMGIYLSLVLVKGVLYLYMVLGSDWLCFQEY